MIPKLGAVVIFTFSHAGRVIAIDYDRYMFACEEGNTSSNLADRNGGQVKIKWRSFYDSTIKGFCYIDYNEQDIPQQLGWVQIGDNWRYYHGSGKDITYIRNDWHKDLNGRWSYFDDNGFALHDRWFEYKGNMYYFDSSCYMVASKWICFDNDIWYYMTADGTMAKDAYVRSQDPLINKYYYLNKYGVYISDYDKTEIDYTKDRIVI
jgi:glucan-binding YG repeat protein